MPCRAGGADDRQAGIVQPDDLDRRQVSGGDAAVGERRPERVEIPGAGIRQRLQQRGVDGAEDGGRGGDADRERADRGQGKRRRPAQSAQRKAKVLEECAHPGSLAAGPFDTGFAFLARQQRLGGTSGQTEFPRRPQHAKDRSRR